MADNSKKGVDPRVDYIYRRVSNAYQIKKVSYEKFKKACDTDENVQRSIMGFLDDSDVSFIFFYQTSSETVTATNRDLPKPQQQLKKKCVVLYKAKHSTSIDKKNYEEEILVTELTKNVLELLENSCSSLYNTILFNELNKNDDKAILSNETCNKFSVLKSQLQVTSNLSKGYPFLPLPKIIPNETTSREHIHVIEAGVIIWNKQIKNVLKEHSNIKMNEDTIKPLDEYNFWKKHSNNLHVIIEQMQKDEIKAILKYLDTYKSTYIEPFLKLQKEMYQAYDEASSNFSYLTQLVPHMEQLLDEGKDYALLPSVYQPILHVLHMIWMESPYFNTYPRLSNVINGVCNAIIDKSLLYIDGKQVFSMINDEFAAEALNKLETVVAVCQAFKECYQKYQGIVQEKCSQKQQQSPSNNSEAPIKPWNIQKSCIFSRLNTFIDRVNDVLDLSQSILLFNKLLKIEIGGWKGKTLTSNLISLQEGFMEKIEKFKESLKENDMLDISYLEFDEKLYEVKKNIKDVEQRISTIISTTLTECTSINSQLKVFESFESFLCRENIQEDALFLFLNVLEQVRSDYVSIFDEFMLYKEKVKPLEDISPQVPYIPPIVSNIYYIRGLLQRISESYNRIILILKSFNITRKTPSNNESIEDNKASLDEKKSLATGKKVDQNAYFYIIGDIHENIKELESRKNQLSQLFVSYEDSILQKWNVSCNRIIEKRMNEHLLYKNKSGEVKVNFSAELNQLIKEVKYLLLLDKPVPEEAMLLYQKSSDIKNQIEQLQDIVFKYNDVIFNLLPVEKPLLESKTKKFEDTLTPGLERYSWNNNNINIFIKECNSSSTEISTVTSTIRNNLKGCISILNDWSKKMFLEKKNKILSPEEYELIHKANVGLYLLTMSDQGKDIQKLLRDSCDAIRVSKTHNTWRNYSDFVNSIVIEGLSKTIQENLKMAISMTSVRNVFPPTQNNNNNSSNKNDAMALVSSLINPSASLSNGNDIPIFEIRLLLEDKQVIFDPPFSTLPNATKKNSIKDIVYGWTEDILSIGTVLTRIDTQSGDYLIELTEHLEIQNLLSTLCRNVDITEMKTEEYRHSYLKFSSLWIQDINISFHLFLTEENPVPLVGNFVDQENNGLSYQDIMKLVKLDMGPNIPSLASFIEKISYYHDIIKQIENIRNPYDITWVRINSSIKSDIIVLAKRWMHVFIDYLFSYCKDRINAILGFIKKLESGFLLASDIVEMNKDESSFDKEKLYQLMTNVRDFRVAENAVRASFEPIRQKLAYLKTMGIVLEESMMLEFDSSLSKMDELRQLCFDAKDKILPMQAREGMNIHKKLDDFAKEIDDFKVVFDESAPYAFREDLDGAYDIIDNLYQEKCKLEKISIEYNNLETLFDLAPSTYRKLKVVNDELKDLKGAYDIASLVKNTFTEWRSTLWNNINTDDLIIRCKEIFLQMKALPQRMKNIDILKKVMEDVVNMQTILPMVDELHKPEMKERHWIQLMVIVGKQFSKGPDFSLNDLLKLELHRKKEDVDEIVEVASKESKNEVKLNNIKKRWNNLALNFIFPPEYEGLPLLGALDEVIEFLESDTQDILQLCNQGKSIEFIQEEVFEWQSKLKLLDNVLSLWTKVQKNWLRLEPIFMKSEDIRVQLPEDTKKFELLDNTFKEMMYEAKNAQLAVEFCNVEGRDEAFKNLFTGIEACEKSLNDYLEQKKKAFPRFYFVSNQALLDILSNGNNPLKVSQYLGDCFDGIKTLKFDLERCNKGSISYGMYSKEKEYIEFPEEFVCSNIVEEYLSRFEEHMRLSVKTQLEAAKQTTENWELDLPREDWLRDYSAQCALVASQIIWTEETSRAFEELESGSENAMKEYKRVCDDRIEKLIKQVRLPLEEKYKDGKNLRVKIITLITIDVHARDVIDKFIQMKLQDSTAFQWQSQLRFYWGTPLNSKTDDSKTCIIKICDWNTQYSYEYVGNCGRLVITPLTDRCYITLTQALNLVLGGAPAGPAGTGKTETTKDLSRAIGLPVVVFNCSDQMTYNTTAQIFMGLAQTGAWGCFDEFNRISIEVLSVVATQVKSVLDALKERKAIFHFMDEEIKLVPTCGFFITMNPGYAGRTELPENLKALFRSCAMIVPDVMFICENMLMAEGFLTARELAHKFVTLYALSKELLSKAMHYDWGLRAVKAVLRQAGGLLRSAKTGTSEQIVLMKALRDFNIPKITTDDKPIFLRLIKDLFPGLNAEEARNRTFEDVIAKECVKAELQPEDSFILKVSQLQEILKVRHCCFVLGPPGSSKSCVWKMLMKSLNAIGEDGVYEELNPKAINTNELYGYVTKNKDWRDGVIAVIMRGMSKELFPYKSSQQHKWIILDGDIDAEWIESMNTVMDDNKVLTLVSNERIPFTSSMRMLFEIENMKNASPATVSRGGVLFINESDVGWKPYVESWRMKLKDETARSQFYLFFTSYFEQNIENIRKNFPFVIPQYDIAIVQNICHFIDALLARSSKEVLEAIAKATIEEQKIHYEALFLFAMMWGLGGGLADDKITPYKKNFSNAFRSIAKIKFPESGLCFDYKWDIKDGVYGWYNWRDYLTEFVAPPNMPQAIDIIVPTTDIMCMNFIQSLHIKVAKPKPLLFVGSVGTGKTVLVKQFLGELPAEILSATVNLNNYTDSLTLQKIIESNVEKRGGKTYGPSANRKLVFFIDDINMPAVDKYGTQNALALLRQLFDYNKLFDRDQLEEVKYLTDVHYLACLNPKAGSFLINPQLQRHFTVITTYTPSKDLVTSIFGSILSQHLNSFDKPVNELCKVMVDCSYTLFQSILANPIFYPSATKFHYNFNLRDLSNLFKGIINSSSSMYKSTSNGVTRYQRLWIHEAMRVFKDRLISIEDSKVMEDLINNTFRQKFQQASFDDVFAQPNLFTSFISMAGGNNKEYLGVKDNEQLKHVLEEKLREYNETHAEMPLVLFNDALEHIARIARIIDKPAGNALLVGVGGSGKQSLSRLAIFSLGFDILTIQVNQSYNTESLRLDFQEMFKKAAVKPATPHVFLLSDVQIIDEKFLIAINDFLSSGRIHELFTREEYDGLLQSVRNAAKATGCPDQRDALMDWFIEKVRSNLHIIVCHSPVGSLLRLRARKFPALVSCSIMNWFYAWPKDALVGVATKFLGDIEFNNDELQATIAENMSKAHLSIDVANAKYLEQERRYNYTTPKSFLELISFYKQLLGKKRTKVQTSIARLERGLETLHDTKDRVENLQNDLNEKMVRVEEKQKAANVLIAQVEKESARAQEEENAANIEAEKVNNIANDAAKIQAIADERLAEALPAMKRAEEAVNCLDIKAIQTTKALATPPKECLVVLKAVMIMKGERKNFDWNNAKRMMNIPQQFLDQLIQFGAKPEDPTQESPAQKMGDDVLALLDPLLKEPFFNKEAMMSKSSTVANICNWVVNIVEYSKIYKNVKPLMMELDEANRKKQTALDELAVVMKQLQDVRDVVAKFDAEKRAAEEERDRVTAEANACKVQLSLAQRLVNGLADENKRWTESVHQLNESNNTLIGDSLLASCFVSYCGAFSVAFRQQLWEKTWLEDIKEKKIPHTDNVDPLFVLANETDIAKWKNERLPADRISIENAAIVTSCSRWPLLIDPQLQGIKWIKTKYDSNEMFVVIQLTQDRWITKISNVISNGGTILIESVPQDLDPLLDPLLSRAVVKQGKTRSFIKLGGEEVDYHNNFSLILQTKLPNPHYRPEVAAQCTLINFIVTPDGLEEQILALVVNKEKPELESMKQNLVRQQNEFMVTLAQLEDDLLKQLSEADPATILENIPLIEGLETTKRTVLSIQDQVKKSIVTEKEINQSRDVYRPVAAEASMLYFLLIQLCIINPMYQFSLDSFNTFLYKAIEKSEANEDLSIRCNTLLNQIRLTIFTWVSRGLFERHKLIFTTLLTFRLLQRGQLSDTYIPEQFNFLLRGNVSPTAERPDSLEWLPKNNWCAIQELIKLNGFELFAQNLEKDAPNRFKEWFNELNPESVKLPLDWKKLDSQPFQKLLVLRCLRPDRMGVALANYIRRVLPNGHLFVDCDSGKTFTSVLLDSFHDSTTTTPIFFILSPGADPVKEVEAIGKMQPEQHFILGKNLFSVSMGEGQDEVAMAKLQLAHKEGYWVMLQNIHLMPKWLPQLEKKLDFFAAEGSSPNFRCFLSADPCNYIPIGILERSVKLTNEPPTGLKENFSKAFNFFSKEEVEEKEAKVKSILFGLCFFHAVMLERKKFGPKGWNMNYPFSIGDLRDSAKVLFNYLEQQNSSKVPWEDLRYIFGEIMYGGHIVDARDRLLCNTYLEIYMKDALLDEAELFPFCEGKASYTTIPPSSYEKYIERINEIPSETPLAFGLHPNAEIGYRTYECEVLFNTLLKTMPQTSSSSTEGGSITRSPHQIAEEVCESLRNQFGDEKMVIDVEGISKNMNDEEKGPYQYVFLQECEYMNVILVEIRRSLEELTLGLKGELSMSEPMEKLIESLYLDKVPTTWSNLAYPSTRALGSWVKNLLDRYNQLCDWTAEPTTIPKVVNVARLINPQSFLTAIKQVTSQIQQLELNKLTIITDVLKREAKTIDALAKDGAYVTGFNLEGARWDVSNGVLEESRPKEMFFPLPVVNCRAQLETDKVDKSIYQCPVYKTTQRGATFVFNAQLKTKAPPAKWVLAGVAIILDTGVDT